jgi:malate dehydrogenase
VASKTFTSELIDLLPPANFSIAFIRPFSSIFVPPITMFARQVLRATQRRCFSASAKQVCHLNRPVKSLETNWTCLQNSRVAVLGASGGIGQPLSLLLKLNPRVTELALYDIRLAPGADHCIGADSG